MSHITTFKGPHFVETYLRKKRQNGVAGELTSLNYFKFDLKDCTLSYKNKKESPEIKKIYMERDLQGFEDKLTEKEKSYCDWKFGFKLITKVKNYFLYAETKENFVRWIRILNFHFNKIDILNPLARYRPPEKEASAELSSQKEEGKVDAIFKMKSKNSTSVLKNLDDVGVGYLMPEISPASQIEKSSNSKFDIEDDDFGLLDDFDHGSNSVLNILSKKRLELQNNLKQSVEIQNKVRLAGNNQDRSSLYKVAFSDKGHDKVVKKVSCNENTQIPHQYKRNSITIPKSSETVNKNNLSVVSQNPLNNSTFNPQKNVMDYIKDQDQEDDFSNMKMSMGTAILINKNLVAKFAAKDQVKLEKPKEKEGIAPALTKPQNEQKKIEKVSEDKLVANPYRRVASKNSNKSAHQSNRLIQPAVEKEEQLSKLRLKSKDSDEKQVEWVELNEEWGESENNKTEETLPVTINRLLNRKVTENINAEVLPKKQKPVSLFDQSHLHIKQSAKAKRVALENLHCGVKDETVSMFGQMINKASGSKKGNPIKSRRTKKSTTHDELQAHAVKLDASRLMKNQEGEEFQVGRKILGSEDNHKSFTINFSIPDKFKKTDNNGDRIKQMTQGLLNQQMGNPVYIGKPHKKEETEENNPGEEESQKDIEERGEASKNPLKTNQNISDLLLNKNQMPNKDRTKLFENLVKVEGQRIREQVPHDDYHTRIMHTYKVEEVTQLGDDFHMPYSEVTQIATKNKDEEKQDIIPNSEQPNDPKVDKKVEEQCPQDQIQQDHNETNLNFFAEDMVMIPNKHIDQGESFNVSRISQRFSTLNLEENWDNSILEGAELEDFNFEQSMQKNE